MDRELRSHIIKLAGSKTRLDGRGFTDYRDVSVETGVLSTAEGSSRVKIGKTEILVGVKVEVMKPYPDAPDKGSIMVGAELLPMSSPNFEQGPPSITAIELARVVDRGIRESKSLDFKGLCIEPGEKVWMIIIDICTINHAGNLFDAASLGVMAALKDMRFPKYEDDKIDYKEKTDKKLEITGTPISVTVLKIGDNFMIDPDIEEEQAVDARLSVATLEDGTLCAMQKGGDTPLSSEEIISMVDLATEKASDLRKHIK
ncbi:exosome complex protein Rrp42 [Candidatus Woesearchaeota archaeon]|nr:exosome complex protein Rrp42 [Candidatus Woesearchaeota archaeon]